MTHIKGTKLFGEKCSICDNVTNQIIVHHINENRYDNPFDGNNWLVLCQPCHMKLHLNKITEV